MTAHFFDYSSYLVGNVSVRQVRIKEEPCKSIATKITQREICVGEYSSLKIDKGRYGLRWNSTENSTEISHYSSNYSEDVHNAFIYKRSRVILFTKIYSFNFSLINFIFSNKRN